MKEKCTTEVLEHILMKFALNPSSKLTFRLLVVNMNTIQVKVLFFTPRSTKDVMKSILNYIKFE